MTEQENRESVELHRAYCRVFEGADGRKVLEDLKARGFFLAPCLGADAQRTAFNEGRRSLVLHVLAMLDRQGVGQGSGSGFGGSREPSG